MFSLAVQLITHHEVRQTNPIFFFVDSGFHNRMHPQCAPLNMYTVAIVFKQKVMNIHLKLKELYDVLSQAD